MAKTKPTPKNVPVFLRLPPELAHRLKAAAEAGHRPVNTEAALIFQAHFAAVDAANGRDAQ